MASNEPYHLEDRAAMVQLFADVDDEGWDVELKSRPLLPGGQKVYRIVAKKGDEGFEAQITDVVVPLSNRTRFVKYTAQEFEDLQAVFGGGQ